MLSTWPRTRSIKIITLILSLCQIHGGIASDICEDPAWPDDQVIARRADIVTSSSSSTPSSSPLPDLLSKITSGNITAGEINCRMTDYTDADVNYYTCTELAQRNNIDVEKFFLLNPEIRPDCGNIKPNSVYCVRGCTTPRRFAHVGCKH
jgi:hypothetical protein